MGACDGRQVVLEGVGNGRWPNNVNVSVNKGGDRFAIEIVEPDGGSGLGKQKITKRGDQSDFADATVTLLPPRRKNSSSYPFVTLSIFYE